MAVYKFTLRLFVLGIILVSSVWYLGYSSVVRINFETSTTIVVVSCFLSLISYYVFHSFKAKFSDQLLILIIGLFTLKLIVYLVFAGIIIWSDKGSANINVSILLGVYFIYTGLETFFKWKSVDQSH